MSTAGQERAPRVTTHCLQCGKEIRVRAERYARGFGRFCSRSCRVRHYPHRHPLGTQFKSRITVPCGGCGKPMQLTEAEARHHHFCSRACVNKGRPPAHPKEKIHKVCLSCGKEFLSFPSTAQRHQYCSRECVGYATTVKHNREKPRTLIEILLSEELTARGILHEDQFHTPPWIVDIALPQPKIAIEADGDYWHSLAAAQQRDARKDAALTALGWTVFRFWEHEIRESPAKCIDKVVAYLASQSG